MSDGESMSTDVFTHTHEKKIKFMSQSRVHVVPLYKHCAPRIFVCFLFSVLFLEMELEHAARWPAPIANNIIDRLGNGKIPMTQTNNDRHGVYAMIAMRSHTC